MNWFGKKEDEKHEENLALPRLPELPKLDDRDEFHSMEHSLPQLPSYPSTHFGKNFSKNVIKDAVVGKKEDEEGSADDFSEEDEMMHEPEKPMTKEFTRDSEKKFPVVRKMEEKSRYVEKSRVRETEPIYVRLDKFRESEEIFDKARIKIEDIERTLKDIKRIKQEEEAELNEWEKEIQEIKNQLEKIDREVFSRV